MSDGPSAMKENQWPANEKPRDGEDPDFVGVNLLP